MGRLVESRCTVEIEVTPASFHAYSPPDLDVGPGDVMVIHDAPVSVGFGETLTRECRATVRRAGWLRRGWVRASGLFALTELYEVGFEAEDV